MELPPRMLQLPTLSDHHESQVHLLGTSQIPVQVIKFGKMKPGDDPETFLRAFEYVAESALWPKEVWAERLGPLLSGDACAVYQALPQGIAEDYDVVKESILDHLGVSERSYQRKFRSLPFTEGAKPRAVAHELRDLARRWLKPEMRSPEEIVEIIVVEQFIQILPPGAGEWISHHMASLSLDIAVQLIESYLAGGDFQTLSAEGHPVVEMTPQVEEQHVEAKTEEPSTIDEDDEEGGGYYTLDLEPHEEEYEDAEEQASHVGEQAQTPGPSIDEAAVGEVESYYTLEDLGANEETVEEMRETLGETAQAPDPSAKESEVIQAEGYYNLGPVANEEEYGEPDEQAKEQSGAQGGASAAGVEKTCPKPELHNQQQLPVRQTTLCDKTGEISVAINDDSPAKDKNMCAKDKNICPPEDLPNQYQVSDQETPSNNSEISMLPFELNLNNEGKSLGSAGNAHTLKPELTNHDKPLCDSGVKTLAFVIECPKQDKSSFESEKHPPTFKLDLSNLEKSTCDSGVKTPAFLIQCPKQGKSGDSGTNQPTFKLDLSSLQKSISDSRVNNQTMLFQCPKQGVLCDSGTKAPGCKLDLSNLEKSSRDSGVKTSTFIIECPQQDKSGDSGINPTALKVELPNQEWLTRDSGVKISVFKVEIPNQDGLSSDSGVKVSSFKVELPNQAGMVRNSGAHTPSFKLQERPFCDSGVKMPSFIIERSKQDRSCGSAANLTALRVEPCNRGSVSCDSGVKTQCFNAQKTQKMLSSSSNAVNVKATGTKPLNQGMSNASGVKAPVFIEVPSQERSSGSGAKSSNFKAELPSKKILTSNSLVNMQTFEVELPNQEMPSQDGGQQALDIATFEVELSDNERSSKESGLKVTNTNLKLLNKAMPSCNGKAVVPVKGQQSLDDKTKAPFIKVKNPVPSNSVQVIKDKKREFFDSQVKAPALIVENQQQSCRSDLKSPLLELELNNQDIASCNTDMNAPDIKIEPDCQEIIDFDNEVMVLAFEIEVPYQETSCGSGIKRPASCQGIRPSNKYMKSNHEHFPGKFEPHETVSGKVIKKERYCSKLGATIKREAKSPRKQRNPAVKRRQSAEFESDFIRPISSTKTSKMHTGERPYACSECSQSFRRSSTLRMHQRTHKREKPHECTECGKRFRKECNLTLHKKIHQANGSRICSVCGMNFRRIGNLIKHEKRHITDQLRAAAGSGQAVTVAPSSTDAAGNEPSCSGAQASTGPESGASLSGELLVTDPETDIIFSEAQSSVDLENGAEIIVETPFTDVESEESSSDSSPFVTHEYECEECGKGFERKSDLDMHRLSHTDQKPYPCTECERVFASMSSLNKHMRAHTRQMHTCDECGEQFSHKVRLYRHQQTHVREKVYTCDECGKSFHLRSQLTKHQQMENIFTCNECGKGFSQYSQLTAHELTHAGDNPFVCCECGQSFPDPTSFIKHHKMHPVPKPYGCPECGKRFSKQNYLIEHLKKNKEHNLNKIVPDC
ncbi:uncharacterized protein [Ambystoma mexicanum]|uniref:uncharacterized protein isoform X2 n=1 Tax=Ambystoma mexicanum TaxID=8296 RepID=UPI0037E7ECFE